MPPRYAYWTILVDDQPTAFRASSQEDLMPTFKRLKLKHASAKMMWWQNGKLWASRLDAQEVAEVVAVEIDLSFEDAEVELVADLLDVVAVPVAAGGV